MQLDVHEFFQIRIQILNSYLLVSSHAERIGVMAIKIQPIKDENYAFVHTVDNFWKKMDFPDFVLLEICSYLGPKGIFTVIVYVIVCMS